MIKYLRIPDEIFDMVKEDIVVNKARGRTDNQKNRGGSRGARQGIIYIYIFKYFIILIFDCFYLLYYVVI